MNRIYCCLTYICWRLSNQKEVRNLRKNCSIIWGVSISFSLNVTDWLTKVSSITCLLISTSLLIFLKIFFHFIRLTLTHSMPPHFPAFVFNDIILCLWLGFAAIINFPLLRPFMQYYKVAYCTLDLKYVMCFKVLKNPAVSFAQPFKQFHIMIADRRPLRRHLPSFVLPFFVLCFM